MSSYADVDSSKKVSILEGLQSRATWIAGIDMFCFSRFGFVTWAASYWSETLA